ncbi:ABC transporter substrate-binding protein [Shewanella avicenniae]|uniref:ABC transporter substrate-binding protein n=1 Tax=Shewanella avicenniae TaxID=2814294 RepID=A0ABX7QT66_9GAMM|nr:ABC transporter substrate-binding protein [Shewanella avicenniae]QSX34110.1 ABC transporter substrate-binding protein [Shewanella avicenniae]
MKKFIYAVMLTVAASLLPQVVAAAEVKDYKDPYQMIKEVADQTFARFEHDKPLIKQDPNHLKVIVREELLPYIDGRYAAYKVLGTNLRQTTEQQRDDFSQAFEGYLVSTYAQAFTEYSDQKVEFGPTSDFANEKIVEVPVQIVENGRPPIKLHFKVRRLKDDTWKAFDLVAEGISLLNSKQTEISSLIRSKGIDDVISMLKDKANASVDMNGPKGKDAL